MPPSDTGLAPTTSQKPLTPAQRFGNTVTKLSEQACLSMLGEEEGRRAAGRVAMAFRSLTARNPAVLDCTPESIAACVATSAMTGLYPSPVNPGCYVIPRGRSVRDGNDWRKIQELNWQISATGLRTLARATGYDVRPTIVYMNDVLAHADGDLDELSVEVPKLRRGPRPDLAADADPLDGIRGVVVVAYDVERQRQIGWGWVPVEAIAERRAISDAFIRGTKQGASDRDRQSPWFVWPLAMVEKTAVRYALTGARAIVPVSDTTFAHALDMDTRSDLPAPTVMQTTPERRQITSTRALDDVLGLGEPGSDTWEPTPEERDRIARDESGS